jgi:hypothetical protein
LWDSGQRQRTVALWGDAAAASICRAEFDVTYLISQIDPEVGTFFYANLQAEGKITL